MSPALSVARRLSAVLLLPGALAACTFPAFGPAPVATPPRPAAPAAPPVDARTAGAIDACRAAAQAQGLQVARVNRTSPVPGPGGVAVSENVFLDVARGAQSFTLRCSYAYASGEARIMTL